jgi:hypothetical protein
MDLRHAVTVLPKNHFRKELEWDKEERRIAKAIKTINRRRYKRRVNAVLEIFMYLNGLITGILVGYIIFVRR